jgi:Putative adhesin
MPTFDTPQPIFASIDIGAGRVRISASDRADTIVEVRPTDESEDADVKAAEATRIEYGNGRLVVEGPKSKLRSLFRRTASIDVTVELPTDSRVDAKGSADVRSEGRLGDAEFSSAAGDLRLHHTGRLKLRTAAGDISVARAVGHADVGTAAGKIWIGEIDGTAVAKTSSGDVDVGEVTGDLRLNTAYGDISVDRALATVAAKTAYGSVRIGEVVRGSVVLTTGYGDLEVGIAAGTAAWLDVNSQFGTVRSDLHAADAPEPAAETVEVRARTGYGDIVIRRTDPHPISDDF